MIISSVITTLFLLSCAPQQEETVLATAVESQSESSATVDAEFTLKTIAEGGKLLYTGVGGDIDGIINPDLVVQPGTIVRIVLINGDGMVHDLSLPDFDVKMDYVQKIGDQTEILLEVGEMQPGSYVYYCTLPGHRKAGQEGKLVVAQP
jgi:nitrite reductase (NO-forming)